MDGENNGKPYFLMDDFGGKPTIFGNTHILKFSLEILNVVSPMGNLVGPLLWLRSSDQASLISYNAAISSCEEQTFLDRHHDDVRFSVWVSFFIKDMRIETIQCSIGFLMFFVYNPNMKWSEDGIQVGSSFGWICESSSADVSWKG